MKNSVKEPAGVELETASAKKTVYLDGAIGWTGFCLEQTLAIH